MLKNNRLEPVETSGALVSIEIRNVDLIHVGTAVTSVSERRLKDAYVSGEVGGRDRGRTGDLIVANDALSQLSYSPTSSREILTRLVEVGNSRVRRSRLEIVNLV